MKDVLGELIGIRSVSGSEKKIIDYIEDFYKDKDVKLVRIHNNLVVEYEGDKTRVFNVHVDTVDHDGNWTLSPFELTKKKGKYFGLGISDMKVSVFILMSLHSFFSKCKNNIILTFVEMEEVNGAGSKKVCSFLKKKDLNEPLCLIGEPTDASWFEYANKGNIFFSKKFLGKSSHSSRPEQGDNAIVKAMNKSKVVIDGLNSLLCQSPFLGQSTLCFPTMICGGRSINTVPSLCEVKGNVRSVEENHYEIIRYLKENKFSIDSSTAPYVCTDAKMDEFMSFQGFEKKVGKGSNDAIFFGEIGIPTVIFGAGTKSAIHKPDEFLIESNIEKTIEVYKDFALF